MKIVKQNLDADIDKLTIIPISDVHIGDKTADLKAFKEVLERIKNEPNTYTILNGDLCNMALKNSKSDIYVEEMSPMEQINKVITFLEPIKDKILVMSSGNHEERTERETGIDITYLVAKQLGIERVYSRSWWYLYLSFGENPRNKHPMLYTITGYHGSGGGGRKSGGKINRLEEMSNVVIADLYLMGHTHKPITTKGVIFTPDYQHKSIVKKELYYLMSNSFLEYEGGYGERMGMMPSNTTITEAQLDGHKKKIKLII